MNIAVVSLKTPEIDSYAAHTFEINKRYCLRHGYSFIGFRGTLAENRPASWSKIPAIKYVMDGKMKGPNDVTFVPDYVMWIDADACFVDHDKRLDDLLPDGKKQVTIAEEAGGINTGVFIIKRSAFSLGLLKAAWGMEQYILDPQWEQTAFRHLYFEEKTGFKELCNIVPMCSLNSLFPSCYKDGDFIAHMAGESDGAREMNFKALKQKLFDDVRK